METGRPPGHRRAGQRVGNQVPRYSGWKRHLLEKSSSNHIMLETKYRDIADGNGKAELVLRELAYVGNQVPRYSGWKHGGDVATPNFAHPLETKYRDIADGNHSGVTASSVMFIVGNQVPRYSGWKRLHPEVVKQLRLLVGNQVPRYSGWKPSYLTSLHSRVSWKPSTAI